MHQKNYFGIDSIKITNINGKQELSIKTKAKIYEYFLAFRVLKNSGTFLVAKLPKTKNVSRAIRTLQIVCGNKIGTEVRQRAKCLVQTLIFDEKNFEEKKSKNENQKNFKSRNVIFAKMFY